MKFIYNLFKIIGKCQRSKEATHIRSKIYGKIVVLQLKNLLLIKYLWIFESFVDDFFNLM